MNLLEILNTALVQKPTSTIQSNQTLAKPDDEISRTLQKIEQLKFNTQVQPPPIFSSESQNEIANNKQRIFDYLLTKEPDRDIVLAAMANMEAESQFIPSRLQGDPKDSKRIENWFEKTGAGRGTGLIQWDDRRTQLKKFADERGKSWADLETQLEFLIHEFKTSEKKAYNKIKQAPNLEVKTRLFATQFERAGTTSADAVVRGKITDEQRENELQRRTENALRLRQEFGER